MRKTGKELFEDALRRQLKRLKAVVARNEKEREERNKAFDVVIGQPKRLNDLIELLNNKSITAAEFNRRADNLQREYDKANKRTSTDDCIKDSERWAEAKVDLWQFCEHLLWSYSFDIPEDLRIEARAATQEFRDLQNKSFESGALPHEQER